jgi:C-terminal processing protease CtpA/Prc
MYPPHLRLQSWLRPIAIVVSLISVGATARSQSVGFQRDRSRDMLRTIKSDVEKTYYDPTFHGVDLNKVFQEADELLKKAESGGQMYGIIARALMQLNDSHTYFISPSRVARINYGWTMQAVGDKCYIAAVQPGSDADRKGVKPGDLIISIDDMNPGRENLWMIRYLYSLRPQPVTHFVLQSTAGETRTVDVEAQVRQGRKITDLGDYDQYVRLMMEEEADARLQRHQYIELGETFIWKMPAFDLAPDKVDELLSKAKNRKFMIIDTRGNGGGAEDTLLRVIGNLFDRDITLGDLVRRKEKKPMIAKTRGGSAFKGSVIVLIDSSSASSAELLARVVQLEKRGTVLGDRSSGAVMRGRHFSHSAGAETMIFYGVSVTDADLVMTDGKSLEKLGVTPDELILPTASDMNQQMDPVLARALELAGIKVSPQKAGAFFQVEWRN